MTAQKPVIVFTEKPRGYTVDGRKVPSVTTVLGILDKPALVPWAAREAVVGAWRLARRRGYVIPESHQEFQKHLYGHRLDYKQANTVAITRGNAVHKVLEDWIRYKKIPVAGEHPKSTRGYVRALAKFIIEWNPTFLESEKLVASSVHGFAGTRDTVCMIDRPDVGRVMLDLKTSKRVYPGTQFPQLMAYEIAGVECGEAPTDKQGIIRVGADGEYEGPVWSCATPEDFLSVLDTYNRQHDLERRAKRSMAEQAKTR